MAENVSSNKTVPKLFWHSADQHLKAKIIVLNLQMHISQLTNMFMDGKPSELWHVL